MLAGFLTLLGIGLLLWLMVRNIRSNPEAFSKENLSKSFTTLGLLALLLIAVVGFVIILLRSV